MEKDEIKHIIADFDDIIESYALNSMMTKNGKERIDLRISFKDSSKMKAFFVAIKGKLKDGYSFQWMDENNQLIICWDNAPHHPEIDTHPYHKHIKTRQNVQRSEEMNLATVLAFIAKTLLVIAFLVTIRQIFVS